MKFMKTKLSFLASKFRLLFKPQATTTQNLEELNAVSHNESSINEDIFTSCCSPNMNEVPVKVKHKHKMCRSRFDVFVNLYQHKLFRTRSRAVSRIPTTQIKRALQKSKKAIIKVQKHFKRVVPQSSRLHAYLSRKSNRHCSWRYF